MRNSSGSVSAPMSMTGGWYVCIIDIGRTDARESERWCGRGEGEGENARSLLKVSTAVADACCARVVALLLLVVVARGSFDGGRAGDDGPGEALFDGGCFWRCADPPHCDMNERTGANAVSERSPIVSRDNTQREERRGEGAFGITSLWTTHDGDLASHGQLASCHGFLSNETQVRAARGRSANGQPSTPRMHRQAWGNVQARISSG